MPAAKGGVVGAVCVEEVVKEWESGGCEDQGRGAYGGGATVISRTVRGARSGRAGQMLQLARQMRESGGAVWRGGADGCGDGGPWGRRAEGKRVYGGLVCNGGAQVRFDQAEIDCHRARGGVTRWSGRGSALERCRGRGRCGCTECILLDAACRSMLRAGGLARPRAHMGAT
jgi:hypothetical protein